MTDPTITIAGLRARINSLLSAVQHSNRTTAERMTMFVEASSNADRLTAERDALAAQLAEVRAELAKAPKVCAIHHYEHEGPCMECGAPWPGAEKALRQERVEGMEKMLRISRAVGCPNSVEEVVEAVAAIKADLASERAHLAACRTRIAGLEQAANERSRTGQMIEPERSEWIVAAVAVADALGGGLGPVAGTSGTIDPREWIHFAAGLADRAKKLTARMAELEARPVLTEDALHGAIKEGFGDWRYNHGAQGWPGTIQIAVRALAALGRVTLPAQDRAEELTDAIESRLAAIGFSGFGGRILYTDRIRIVEESLASLGAPPTSPPAARPVFAGVSEEELDAAFEAAYRAESVKSASGGKDPRRAAIRAVLARLEVSLVTPVDPREFALVMIMRDLTDDNGDVSTTAVEAAARYALTARGIPVTPEVDK